VNKAVITSIVFMLIMAVGCAGAPGPRPDTGFDAEIVCIDRTMRVRQVAGFLSVNPEYIDICSESILTVQITPPAGMGPGGMSANTNQGMSAGGMTATWLDKTSNTAGNRIVIPVPANTTLDDYKFSITIPNVGTLDPRVRVVR